MLIAFITGTTCATARGVQRVMVNGTELAYVQVGRGTPVVLVHGGMQDYRLWQGHLDVFGQRYRAIAYSRRNHFPNAVDANGISDRSGDVHGNDLAGLIEGLGLGRAHVVAHSGGALAALYFAANHPELVRTLVVVRGNEFRVRFTRHTEPRSSCLPEELFVELPVVIDVGKVARRTPRLCETGCCRFA